jgi:hypothetical protein
MEKPAIAGNVPYKLVDRFGIRYIASAASGDAELSPQLVSFVDQQRARSVLCGCNRGHQP